MKLCIISPYFTPFVNGSENGLAKKLSELGHEVTIVTSTSLAPREKMVSNNKYSEEYNYDVIRLSSIDFYENPLVISVFLHVLQNDYDIIMLREDYPIMCILAFFAAKIKRIPLTLSSDRNYSLSISNLKGFLLKILDSTVNKFVRNGVDAYIAHCSSVKEFVIDELKTTNKVEVIHIGIDTNFFKPVDKGTRYLVEGTFKILTVARLHNHKGLEYLVKAMSLVVEKNSGAILYIKGKGDEEKNLKDLIDTLGINKNIIFLKEAIPGDELAKFYSECDLYVQPSIIEPFGIAVLEAMACGKPVVGTKIGGMLDTIVDGVTGFSVPPANPEELSTAIIRLIDDEDLRIKMGENARKESLQYDWNVIGKKYLDVINSL